MEELIDSCADCIRCPAEDCLTPFFVEPGDELAAAPQGVVGLDGRPLTAAALKDFNHNRFRCPCCDNDFCGACSAMPYHLGQTCAEASGLAVTRHCRFCTTLLEPHPHDTREFMLLNPRDDEEWIAFVNGLSVPQLREEVYLRSDGDAWRGPLMLPLFNTY